MNFSYEYMPILKWMRKSKYKPTKMIGFEDSLIGYVKRDERNGFFEQACRKIEYMTPEFLETAFEVFGTPKRMAKALHFLPVESCIVAFQDAVFFYGCREAEGGHPIIKMYYFLMGAMCTWYMQLDTNTMKKVIVQDSRTDYMETEMKKMQHMKKDIKIHLTDEFIMQVFGSFISSRIYRIYGDIEDKVLPSKGSVSISLGKETTFTSDFNETVHVIGPSWLTNSYRLEGFKVRAHPRWQPIGPNRCDVKLIMIKEFEKHGYTRKAGILTDEEATTQRYLNPIREE